MIIIGVDTGGTFTDFVFKEGDCWAVFKVLSTPSNPATAVCDFSLALNINSCVAQA